MDVKFLKGTQADYDALKTKESTSFYYATDSGNFYLGEIKLSNAEDIDTLADDLSFFSLNDEGLICVNYETDDE